MLEVPGRSPAGTMTPAEQLKEYQRILSVQDRLGGLPVGSKHYLLNRKWFVQWLQWIGHPRARARAVGRLQRTKSATLGEDFGEGAPLKLRSVPELPAPELARARSWTKDQPGPIDNEILLEETNSDCLRRGVFEHLDFVIVSAEIWNLLLACYGGGPAIGRHAIRMQSGEVQVEVHLLKVRACRVLDHQRIISCDMSRAATVADLRLRLCHELGLEPAKARVLNHVGSEDECLENCRILADQLFLIDEQLPDSTWASDKEETEASLTGTERASPKSIERASPKSPDGDWETNMRTVGLKNLGNTCFMNSSLQCLANIPPLSNYFLTGDFRSSLKIYGQSTQGTQGRLAESFAKLLQSLWTTDEDEVEPWDFKAVVGKFAERFTGARQHDSMEFLEFLVDGLKEDCNRVKGRKLYVERSDANGREDVEVAREAGSEFLLRNDSDIDDLLVGFFKSSVTCPDDSCCQESIAFDPFLSLKLPIMSAEKSRSRSFRVDLIPLASSAGSIERYRVTIQKFGSIDVLVRAVAAEAGVDPETCVLAEIYKAKVYKFFEESDRLEDISSEDILVMYELQDAAVFKKPASKRWGLGTDLKDGDVVFVKQAFASDGKSGVLLQEKLYGLVQTVDDDGDAFINFDGLESVQLVFSHNLDNLVVDGAVKTDMRKVDPEDDQVYTLNEMITMYAGQDIGGEIWTIQKLMAYWKDTMLDADDVPEPKCGVIVSFRKAARNEEEKPEHFGIPIVFCIQRDTPVSNLIKEVRRELKTRNMPSTKKSKWTFYKTREGSSYDTEILLTEGDEETEETIRFGERQYLVLEWEGKNTPEAPEIDDDEEKEEEEENEVTLEMCFRWMTDREQLSEEDVVYCKNCADFRRSYKKVDIWSLPPVLMLQLKRFEFTGVQRRRLNTKVHFPLEGLDLRDFILSQMPSFPKDACLRFGQHVGVHGLTSGLGQKLNGAEGIIEYVDSSTGTARWCVRLDDAPDILTSMSPENLKVVSSSRESTEPIFDLAAVSKHIGGASFGHYVAYARSSQNGLWYLFDDEDVTEVSPEDVADESEGAYVLFYLRRDCRPQSWSM